MSTNKNKPPAWWYFTAGLDPANQDTYKSVKARIAASIGSEPSNLTIMVELMKSYLKHNQENADGQ